MLYSPFWCPISLWRSREVFSKSLKRIVSSKLLVPVRGPYVTSFVLFIYLLVDIVERFTLSLMLVIVAFRNLIELSGSEFDFTGGFGLPKSWVRGNSLLWTISYVRTTDLCVWLWHD